MAARQRSGRTRVDLIGTERKEIVVNFDRKDDRDAGRELNLHRREIGRRDVAVRCKLVVRRIGNGRGTWLRRILSGDVRHVGERCRTLLLQEVERGGDRDPRVASAVELVVDERRAEIQRRVRALGRDRGPDVLPRFVAAHRIRGGPADARPFRALIADTGHFRRQVDQCGKRHDTLRPPDMRQAQQLRRLRAYKPKRKSRRCRRSDDTGPRYGRRRDRARRACLNILDRHRDIAKGRAGLVRHHAG